MMRKMPKGNNCLKKKSYLEICFRMLIYKKKYSFVRLTNVTNNARNNSYKTYLRKIDRTKQIQVFRKARLTELYSTDTFHIRQ